MSVNLIRLPWGQRQNLSLGCCLILDIWLQMEQSCSTRLILAICSDASVSVVLWCHSRPSGLDNTTTLPLSLLNSSIIYHPKTSVGGVSALPSPLDSPPAVPSTHIPTEQTVYMCLFRWIKKKKVFIYHHQYSVCMRASAYVCLIYSWRQKTTLT